MAPFIGCAGWNLRKEFAGSFSPTGTHLQRYGTRLNCVEINSSFYRSHRKKTYERWAESTPEDFRFSVKIPKQITHIRRLVDVEREALQFVDETAGLGSRLGAILVQLPPSLEFELSVAGPFFRDLRRLVGTSIVCEPRHFSWFGPEAEALMAECLIARVAADPSIVPCAATPGGCSETCYFRWHGSPRTYYSAYDEQTLGELAKVALASANESKNVWCIFDNTAVGAAWMNATTLFDMLYPAANMGPTRWH